MTYMEFINNIIAIRGQWNIPEGQYWEGHHIKPKCMGGKGNTRRKDPNIIWLLLPEHVDVHRLLAEENPNNRSLVYAYECMSKMKDVEAEAAKRYEMYHNPKNHIKKKHDDIYKKPTYREKISKDECGQNQQFVARSKPIKCTMLATGKEYYFKSIRAGAIWWHKHYPLRDKFSEYVYQRKIKQSIRGVQPQYKGAIIEYIKWERVVDDDKDKN